MVPKSFNELVHTSATMTYCSREKTHFRCRRMVLTVAGRGVR